MFTIAIPVYKYKAEFPFVLKTIAKLNKSLISEINIYIEPTNDTLKIINEIKKSPLKIHYFINRERLGMVGNWNQCILNCKSQYLIINHDDDYLFPNILDIYYTTFIKHPELGLVGSCYPLKSNEFKVKLKRIIVDLLLKRGFFHRKIIYFYQKGDINRFIKDFFQLPCSSSSFNIGLLKQNYLFSSKYQYSTDEEFWYRILNSFPIAVIKNCYVKINRSGNNYEYETWKKDDFMIQFIEIRKIIYKYSGNNHNSYLLLRNNLIKCLTPVFEITGNNNIDFWLNEFDEFVNKASIDHLT
jgi:hypothetical protein